MSEVVVKQTQPDTASSSREGEYLGIGETMDLVGEIVAASQEQAQGVEQANIA